MPRQRAVAMRGLWSKIQLKEVHTMNSTALGARKITFISEAHEKSYYEKLEFFQFSQKAKFDPEHIGTMYMNTIRANQILLKSKYVLI